MIDLTIKMRNYGPIAMRTISTQHLVQQILRRGGFKPLQQCLTICGRFKLVEK
jgi:hypothetical protein